MDAPKTTTNFKHSIKVSFGTKLLMNELPLQDKLVRRHPDIYKSDWKCVLCNTEQESWSHLWRCPHLQPRIQSLLIATKAALRALLDTYISALPSSFDNDMDSVSCWSLPDATAPHHVLSFDSLIRGLVPSALTNLLLTVTSKSNVAAIINNICGTAQSIFRDDVWNYRCEEFNEWEKRHNIDGRLKKSSSAGYKRDPATNSIPSRSSTSDRWKSWISQSIDTGRPWLGFRIHINSLVPRLVQLLF
jgi:hypothetical protein